MQSAQAITDKNTMNLQVNYKIETSELENAIAKSWDKIAPFWPLRNLIAVNPLSGFENLPFEDALKQGCAFFQYDDLPDEMLAVNRESIKWLQAYFDRGQSTISMPGRADGFLSTMLRFMPHDRNLVSGKDNAQFWLKNIPAGSSSVIGECLLYLGIPKDHHEVFLSLMLTTLPGWAGHIRYRADWADTEDLHHPHPVSKEEYLAFRLLLTCLLWPGARALLGWHARAQERANVSEQLGRIEHFEKYHRAHLLDQLQSGQHMSTNSKPEAQLVFCIDVRSEPFRASLEAQGEYETFGFAGFFGVPVSIENEITGEHYHSCPVLLQPAHHVKEVPVCAHEKHQAGHARQKGIKKLYQSLKYNFTVPFALVEMLGPAAGVWMALRSLAPTWAQSLKRLSGEVLNPAFEVRSAIENIPHADQVAFAAGALRMMGLTKNFAPLVVLCGHGSTTQNNAYATALDCGACGGRHGAPNARILATILNRADVRSALGEQDINIPDGTHFLAGEHNTTTDQVELYECDAPEAHNQAIEALKADLEKARVQNALWRCTQLDEKSSGSAQHALRRAQDWAQVRPEWGLARNAAFIVGPRSLTKNVTLEGRCFLHSYDWAQDPDGQSLATILTAPMVVAQWINSQYLFSTLDNVAYGGGSKITKNITGKIGIMQGNASDLMNGLPLQSVFKADGQAYHEPARLMTIVCAPRAMVGKIIAEQEILQKLFGNGWVSLVCIDPLSNERMILQRDLTWAKVQ